MDGITSFHQAFLARLPGPLTVHTPPLLRPSHGVFWLPLPGRRKPVSESETISLEDGEHIHDDSEDDAPVRSRLVQCHQNSLLLSGPAQSVAEYYIGFTLAQAIAAAADGCHFFSFLVHMSLFHFPEETDLSKRYPQSQIQARFDMVTRTGGPTISFAVQFTSAPTTTGRVQPLLGCSHFPVQTSSGTNADRSDVWDGNTAIEADKQETCWRPMGWFSRS